MTSTTFEKPASPPQLTYLAAIWSERSDAPFPYDAMAARTSREVSALIQTALKKAALPCTDEQGDEIVALSRELGITVVVQADRAAANRQLRDLRTKVNRKEWNAALSVADAELDSLLAGDEPASVDEEPVPF